MTPMLEDGTLLVRLDPEHWACGLEKGDAALLNIQGNMCCLGFASLELGATRDEISNQGMPYNIGVPEAVRNSFEAIGCNRGVLSALSLVNDSIDYNFNLKARVQMLNDKAEELGARIRFELVEASDVTT